MDPTGTPACGLNAGQILSRCSGSLCEGYVYAVNSITVYKLKENNNKCIQIIFKVFNFCLLYLLTLNTKFSEMLLKFIPNLINRKRATVFKFIMV